MKDQKLIIKIKNYQNKKTKLLKLVKGKQAAAQAAQMGRARPDRDPRLLKVIKAEVPTRPQNRILLKVFSRHLSAATVQI
jgi:hypothetical protein